MYRATSSRRFAWKLHRAKKKKLGETHVLHHRLLCKDFPEAECTQCTHSASALGASGHAPRNHHASCHPLRLDACALGRPMKISHHGKRKPACLVTTTRWPLSAVAGSEPKEGLKCQSCRLASPRMSRPCGPRSHRHPRAKRLQHPGPRPTTRWRASGTAGRWPRPPMCCNSLLELPAYTIFSSVDSSESNAAPDEVHPHQTCRKMLSAGHAPMKLLWRSG